MPSPFPGMDPWLEHPAHWPDVHGMLIMTLRETLARELRPRYIVTMDERVYIDDEEPDPRRRPDVIVSGAAGGESSSPGHGAATPVIVPTVIDVEVHERFLEVRDVESRDVVTVVEMLSPTNKRGPASAGRQQYLKKRRRVLRSVANLVELDLLRAGHRVPMGRSLPVSDYFAIVSRPDRRPDCEVYPVRLRERLPRIAFPLRGDETLTLDLQPILDTAFDRAGYDLSVDHDADPAPPLDADDRAWARDLVSTWRARR